MDLTADQAAYRDSKPSMLGRGIERLTHPFGKALASVVPSGLVKAAIKRIDQAASGPALIDFTHDTDDIDACREAAAKVERTARTINASTGAAAGLGGAWTMGADIPATIGIAMRNIRDTGRAYGFDGGGATEQVFRLKILELAATNDPQERSDLIDSLHADISPKGGLIPASDGDITPLVDQAVERVSRALAFASVRNRLGMMVPLAGSVVGGMVNSSFQKDVSAAARYAFQARRMKDGD